MVGALDYIKVTGNTDQAEKLRTAISLLTRATDLLVALDAIHQHQHDTTLLAPDDNDDARYAMIKTQYGVTGAEAKLIEQIVGNASSTLDTGPAMQNLRLKIGP